jgi:hypothetical protein
MISFLLHGKNNIVATASGVLVGMKQSCPVTSVNGVPKLQRLPECWWE